MKYFFFAFIICLPFSSLLSQFPKAVVDQRATYKGKFFTSFEFRDLEKEFPNGFEIIVFHRTNESGKWEQIETSKTGLMRIDGMSFITENFGFYEIYFFSDSLCRTVKCFNINKNGKGSGLSRMECPE